MVDVYDDDDRYMIWVFFKCGKLRQKFLATFIDSTVEARMPCNNNN